MRGLGEAGLANIGGGLLAIAWGLLAVEESWLLTPVATYFAGLGFYKLHNTLQTNATQMAPSVRGTAVSLFASAFFLGQSLGVYVASQVFERVGSIPLFIGAAVLVPCLSSVFALLLKRHQRQLATQ